MLRFFVLSVLIASAFSLSCYQGTAINAEQWLKTINTTTCRKGVTHCIRDRIKLQLIRYNCDTDSHCTDNVKVKNFNMAIYCCQTDNCNKISLPSSVNSIQLANIVILPIWALLSFT